MFTWLRELAGWMAGLAHHPSGPAALFTLAAAEASVFPLPPDILLIALGLSHPEGVWWFAAICTLGSTAGGAAGYGIGRFGGRPLLDRWVSAPAIVTTERLFQRYDVWAVGIAGFTPIPYKVFTIAGGVFRIDFWRFLGVSFVSRGGRFFLVGGAVALFGERARPVLEEYFELITVAFAVLLIGGFLFVRWWSARLHSKEHTTHAP
ncbi:MAG TPA: VTT domain-containing protein [bacterium]